MNKARKIALAALTSAFVLSVGLAFPTLAANASQTRSVAVSSNLTMLGGASIRLDSIGNEDNSGIKFTAEVAEVNESSTYGAMIVPYDYFVPAGVTISDGTDYVSLFQTAAKENDIPFAPVVTEGLTPLRNEKDGKNYITFSLTSLQPNNYDRKFFGVIYEKTADGVIEYAAFNDNTRAVMEIASGALNDLHYNEALDTETKTLFTNYQSVLDGFVNTGVKNAVGATGSVDYQVGGESGVESGSTTSFSVSTSTNVYLQHVWESSDPSVAVVDRNGVVTGVSAGTANITAKSANNAAYSASKQITVSNSATMGAVVDSAYALEQGGSMAESSTLMGTVISVGEAVTISVAGREEKPVRCYGMVGGDTVGVGDVITVTGTLQNSGGAIQFAAGCTLESTVAYAAMPKAVKVALVKDSLSLGVNSVSEDGAELALPLNQTEYSEIGVQWSSSNERVAAIEGNVATFTLLESAQTVTLTATVSDGTTSFYKAFEIAVSAAPALSLGTSTPTTEQLEAGYTYDWVNTSMPVSNAKLIPVSKIDDANALAAIQGANGFGANVVHLEGTSTHDLTALTKAAFADFFTPNWVYTIEFDYYAVAHGTSYLIAYDGGSNSTIGSIFSNGLQHDSIEYTVTSAHTGLTLFASGEMDIYLGNLKITGVAPVEVREDYHSLTATEMFAGYTYDWRENNLLQFSNNVSYVKVNRLENQALVAALQNSGKYTTGYAMKYAGQGSAEISCLTNQIYYIDDTYTITFEGYDMGNIVQLCILQMNSSNQQIGSEIGISWSMGANGIYTGTATFKPASNCKKLILYGKAQVEAYFASVSFKITEPAFKGVPLGSASLNVGNKGTQGSAPAAVANRTGFHGSYGSDALQFTMNTSTPNRVYEMFDLTSFTSGASKVQITIYYYIPSALTDSGLYLYNGTGTFTPIVANVGYNVYTITFTGSVTFLCLHMNASTQGMVYIGGIDIVKS